MVTFFQPSVYVDQNQVFAGFSFNYSAFVSSILRHVVLDFLLLQFPTHDKVRVSFRHSLTETLEYT